jgi:hypothetical protein
MSQESTCASRKQTQARLVHGGEQSQPKAWVWLRGTAPRLARGPFWGKSRNEVESSGTRTCGVHLVWRHPHTTHQLPAQQKEHSSFSRVGGPVGREVDDLLHARGGNSLVRQPGQSLLMESGTTSGVLLQYTDKMCPWLTDGTRDLR